MIFGQTLKSAKNSRKFFGYYTVRYISTKTVSFMTDCGIDLNKLHGERYVYAPIVRKEDGVSILIRDKYPKLYFFTMHITKSKFSYY